MGKMGQEEWVIKVDDELKQMENSSTKETEQQCWKKRSIYRLPASIKDLNKKAYMPQVVSFGPYHHGEEHLQAMEEHKHRVLLRFLKRSNKPLKAYIESLAPVVQDLKDSYDSLDPIWQQDTDAFLQLMILDGCFMLEILHSRIHHNDYHINDPIFSYHAKLYIMPYFKRDMLLLENQLPMLALEKIFALQNIDDKIKGEDLLNLLNKDILGLYSPNAPDSNLRNCLHVLDMYRVNILCRPPRRRHRRHWVYDASIFAVVHKLVHKVGKKVKRSATELDKAGIRFRKAKSGSLEDISFHRGVLTVPVVIVDDATKSVFLNIIAFERFHIGAGTDVTSYIFFMNIMINNAKDVSKLHSKGIIRNVIGGDEDVANLFSSLSKDTMLDPNCSLYDVLVSIETYCRKPWNQWRATFIYTYFRNLIHTTTVVAGIALFALAAIQTVYTVYPFYR